MTHLMIEKGVRAEIVGVVGLRKEGGSVAAGNVKSSGAHVTCTQACMHMYVVCC
jgi:hypothetical protein